MLQQDGEPPAAQISSQHVFQHGQRDARFVADPRNPAVARVERVRQPADKRIGPAVKGAYPPPEIEVRSGRSELFDPWVLVRRNRLLGQLPADPVRFFGQDNPGSAAQGPQRCCNAARTSANDHHIGASLAGRGTKTGVMRAQCANPGDRTQIAKKIPAIHQIGNQYPSSRDKTPCEDTAVHDTNHAGVSLNVSCAAVYGSRALGVLLSGFHGIRSCGKALLPHQM